MVINQVSIIDSSTLQEFLEPLEEESNGWFEPTPKKISDPVEIEKFVGLDYGQQGVEFLDWFDVFVE